MRLQTDNKLVNYPKLHESSFPVFIRSLILHLLRQLCSTWLSLNRTIEIVHCRRRIDRTKRLLSTDIQRNNRTSYVSEWKGKICAQLHAGKLKISVKVQARSRPAFTDRVAQHEFPGLPYIHFSSSLLFSSFTARKDISNCAKQCHTIIPMWKRSEICYITIKLLCIFHQRFFNEFPTFQREMTETTSLWKEQEPPAVKTLCSNY